MAWLTTRDTVADALDIAANTRTNNHLDRAIAAATSLVEDDMRRQIIPWQGTRYFDWPPRPGGNPTWLLRLGHDNVTSVTTVTAAGTAVTGWTLEPNGEGPPYTQIQMPRTGSGFTHGDTPQRNIAVTGVFAIADARIVVDTLTGTLTDSATSHTFATTAPGVGSLLVIDDERLTVTERSYTDTGSTLTAALTSSTADTTVTVSDATGFTEGEIIQIDSERMRVDTIAGLDLTVKRQADGSVLAEHAATTAVYAARTATLTRGAQGTTAASHTASTVIERWDPPALLEQLAVAVAIDLFENDRAGWARTVGAGDAQREARGVGVERIRRLAIRAHGRRNRTVAV